MGSFSYITFDDYPILEHKNGYYSEVAEMFFLPSDFIVETRPYSTRNKLFWGDAYINEKGNFTFTGFRQTAKNCRHRLEIYGHSIIKAKADFYRTKRKLREDNDYDYRENEIINKTTFNQYLNEISGIIYNKEKKSENSRSSLKDILVSDDLMIDYQSIADSLYIILSLLPDDSIIEYDLSDVIGYLQEEVVLQINFEKIIILTEGKTDVEFISKSLEKLYPHIFPYYHFINFDEYKVESNASALVKLVTSLIAANIQHPIIALFDNDTTGIMEMKKLERVKASNNFRVFKYPNLKFARKYPTVGPTGLKNMNINGLACSIEMYLGEDILKKEDKFIPVLWKSYNEKEKKYQGEISEKKYVQEAFREKLKTKLAEDFFDIDLILKQIFSAFEKKN